MFCMLALFYMFLTLSGCKAWVCVYILCVCILFPLRARKKARDRGKTSLYFLFCLSALCLLLTYNYYWVYTDAVTEINFVSWFWSYCRCDVSMIMRGFVIYIFACMTLTSHMRLLICVQVCFRFLDLSLLLTVTSSQLPQQWKMSSYNSSYLMWCTEIFIILLLLLYKNIKMCGYQTKTRKIGAN